MLALNLPLLLPSNSYKLAVANRRVLNNKVVAKRLVLAPALPPHHRHICGRCPPLALLEGKNRLLLPAQDCSSTYEFIDQKKKLK